MGHLDQLAKRTFATETPVITSNGVLWEDPPEIPTADLHADGYMLVADRDKLTQLPAPWRAAAEVDEILIEIKTPGNHVDALQYERALLRRQARQVQRVLKAEQPDTSDTALWLVAPNLPEWLTNRRVLSPLAPGCFRIEPAWFQVLWIAANELPLSDNLVPFLVARSGRALDEFVRWIAPRRSLLWLFDMLEYLPMSTAAQNDMMPLMAYPQDDPQLEARRQYIIRYLFDHSPWLQNEVERKGVQKGIRLGLEQGREQGREQGLAPLLHQFERRLRRALTTHERAAIARQLGQLGANRIGDLVLESTPQQLAAWLDLATIR